MKRLFLSVFAVMLVGCDPSVSVFRWESNPEYRAYAATRLAEAVMETPSVVVPDEEEDEELCDGSGWVVHGDGHKTPCPGCKACAEKARKEPEVIIQEVEVIREVTVCDPASQECKPSSTVIKKRGGLLNRLFNRR